MRIRAFICLSVFLASTAVARQEQSICGTRPGRWREERFLHRQSLRNRALHRARTGPQLAAPSAAGRDAGNIAILEDADGVVARLNQFDLDRRTLTFHPGGGGAVYGYLMGEGSYDAGAASDGTPLAGLGDDDSRLIPIPFAFPFYGQTYREVYVNSDGNLTFTKPDNAASDRSAGRVTAGPPRIAPLFDDLDPSSAPAGVRVLAEEGRLVVTWAHVPEFSDTGFGGRQTFQVRLYPSGGIEFAWDGVTANAAVVGIAPGGLTGSSALVSFATDPFAEYSGAILERFGGSLELDVTTAAQKFYQTHEDAYDYIAFFNNMDIPAADSAVAYELTVRNSARGFGDEPVDVGSEYGSPSRLRAVLNLGQLTQYPEHADDVVSSRRASEDTPVSIIAHEAGHLFLAYASVRDPANPDARPPMLGYQGAHWYFGFNSEASLLEGNRLRDDGPSVSPRFLTTGVTEGYSPLDQYLMGFRPPTEVEPEHQIFYVDGAPASFAFRHQQKGVAFNGSRRDVHMDELLGVLGRRTPDHTVAQRRFRFAFVLVVRQGTEPSAEDLAKLEGFRAAFEQFYEKAASGRATADATLKLNLRLSLFPAAGVLAGGTAGAEVAVDTPPAAPLEIELRTQAGVAGMPRSVTIPAGARSVAFTVAGIQPGVEELSAVPSDDRYMTAAARVQVAPAAALMIAAVSGDGQVSNGTGPLPEPIVLRVADANGLPYPGARLTAAPSAGGAAEPQAVSTDANGQAVFRWTPGAAPESELRIALEGAPEAALTVHAGTQMVAAKSVFNTASMQPRLAPGTLASISGTNLSAGAVLGANLPWPNELSGVRVLINGTPAPLLWVSGTQIDFLIPRDVPEGTAEFRVANARGTSPPLQAPIAALAPGIYFDASTGYGNLVDMATRKGTWERPARAGDVLAISCTGLGPITADGTRSTVLTPEVSIGGVRAEVVASAQTREFDGLFRVDARVPAGLPSGAQQVTLSLGGVRSNTVTIAVE